MEQTGVKKNFFVLFFFWYHNNANFTKCIQKCPLLFYFLKKTV